MFSLNESTLRASLVNATRKEVSDLTLPTGFDQLDWDKLDYLGWRDPKLPKRAYAVIPFEGEPVGILLKQAEATPRKRAQCSWCQDVTLPNEVVFYSARRVGPGGRNGDTVGILVCADFQCSVNVRKRPPMAYIGFDVEAARLERIASLQERVAGFADVVLNDR
ncbi:FBP domain-containing protein [Rathayibacter sp. YIM 133350]|uniref:FBP domain-containing protein n=1 Tax=Rathayibacter sp. YIM 133350 TaxID=3131992 RepID=UPI00307DC6A1